MVFILVGCGLVSFKFKQSSKFSDVASFLPLFHLQIALSCRKKSCANEFYVPSHNKCGLEMKYPSRNNRIEKNCIIIFRDDIHPGAAAQKP